jgi:hypothetical protein
MFGKITQKKIKDDLAEIFYDTIIDILGGFAIRLAKIEEDIYLLKKQLDKIKK